MDIGSKADQSGHDHNHGGGGVAASDVLEAPAVSEPRQVRSRTFADAMVDVGLMSKEQMVNAQAEARRVVREDRHHNREDQAYECHGLQHHAERGQLHPIRHGPIPGRRDPLRGEHP